jgi:Platelet-activating factor acetylhydrolase, isoform II
MRSFKKVKMDVAMEGVLSPEYWKGKPLIPIIFSHGVGMSRTFHSGLCRDFAS